MSETICPHPDCDTPTPDGLICAHHTTRLRRDLEQLPDLIAELDVTLTRQARVGSGASEDRTPLPVNMAASEVGWAVRNTLLAWVRTLELGDMPTEDEPAEWARWLLARIERIRGHAEGGMCADEIGYCVVSIRRVVDRPAEAMFCGPCPICGADLYAKPGALSVVCRRCERAGIEAAPVDVPAARLALRVLAEDMLVTREEALRACPSMAGVEIPRKVLDMWVVRGSVADRGGKVLLREVLDAAAGYVARRRA